LKVEQALKATAQKTACTSLAVSARAQKQTTAGRSKQQYGIHSMNRQNSKDRKGLAILGYQMQCKVSQHRLL
jgi:hypothetical protein